MPESSLITIRRIRWSASRTRRLSIAAVAAIVAICFTAFRTIVSAAESTVVIECCNLFDPASGTMLPEQTIVIRGSQVVHVAGSDEVPEIPADATRIDGRGKFALPGLIDAHVHVVHVLDFAHITGDEVLPLYLAAGVTSIRSTGDEVVAATLVARFAAAHPEFCPRVFTCSPLLDADPPIHRDVGRAVTDPTGVPELFDDLGQWDITTVKIYAGTSRPVGRAIIEESHRRGLFVTAHLGRYSPRMRWPTASMVWNISGQCSTT